MLETEFRWDGRDAYGRRVFGASTVKIEAGYEYADCPETVVIEKTAVVDARAPKDDKVTTGCMGGSSGRGQPFVDSAIRFAV